MAAKSTKKEETVLDRLDKHMKEMLGSNPNAVGGASRKRKRDDSDVCVALDVSVLSSLFLQGFELYINGKLHTILEVELYITSESHPDPFTHCNEVQKVCGMWYFHRSGTGGGKTGYRGGSFKGLDISIGGEGRTGGVLIRTIRLGAFYFFFFFFFSLSFFLLSPSLSVLIFLLLSDEKVTSMSLLAPRRQWITFWPLVKSNLSRNLSMILARSVPPSPFFLSFFLPSFLMFFFLQGGDWD